MQQTSKISLALALILAVSFSCGAETISLAAPFPAPVESTVSSDVIDIEQTVDPCFRQCGFHNAKRSCIARCRAKEARVGSPTSGIFKGEHPCTVKFVPGSDKWEVCMGNKPAKLSEDQEASMCRGKCGSKPSAFGGYFQCMDKCLGRKR